MPKTSPLLVWEPSRLRTLAFRLRNRMNELRLTERELAERCQAMAETGSSLSRERLAKILMHCCPCPKPSAARVVLESELRLLAKVLKVSPEWLTGMGQLPDPILWDVLAHSERAQEILHLLDHHEQRSRETLVWAEGLMCSFLTPDFLHDYHEAFFAELEAIGQRERKQELVEVYDKIGTARRNRRLNGAGPQRQFTQLILRSDLERIAHGMGEYRRISRSVRRRCVENVRGLLEKEGGRIALVVVEDERVGELARALRTFDSIGVCVKPDGEMFGLLRMRMGDVLWSENRDYVSHYIRLLEALCERASCRNRDDVLRLLDRLLETMR
ncbi:MAG: hypothetical protein V2G41_10030 [bacterium JZ-2024 1]